MIHILIRIFLVLKIKIELMILWDNRIYKNNKHGNN